jgi:Flp pilus assembly protein TadD
MRQNDSRALDYAQRAFQQRPNDAVTASTLGAVLLQRGRTYEAVQMLQKAVQIDPGNAEARFLFVQSLAAAGDRTRARAELKALLASDKSFPQLAQARALAEKL